MPEPEEKPEELDSLIGKTFAPTAPTVPIDKDVQKEVDKDFTHLGATKLKDVPRNKKRRR